MSLIDNITNLLKAGANLPEAVIIPQPVVDPTGKVYLGLGWEFSGDLEAGGWVKVRPKDRAIADGMVAVLDGLRKQASREDQDSPGRLTLYEVAEVLTGVALGKR